MSFSDLNTLMNNEFEKSDKIYHPSSFWQSINEKNNGQIDDKVIDNFKRTIVKNYFTLMRVLPWDSQIIFLVKSLGFQNKIISILRTFSPIKQRHIPLAESLALNFMTQLTWRYVNLLFPEMLSTLAEPAEGNPPEIYSGNKLISQDIANSVLEFDSMNFDNRLSDARVVCELGGGYGRTAYVVQRQHGGCKYIMVDIPPALAVAQTYMEQVFPNRKIFGFRPFRTFEEVRNDVANADIVFLLPHQMALLPDEFIDYFINISSLHEMRQEQIDLYLHEIFRLTAPGGSFYLKAWKTSKNPVDKVEIRAEDYRLSDWTPLYHRTARIQTRFFETVLKKP